MFTRGSGLHGASKKTVMTCIAFQNWRHTQKEKKNTTTIAAVRWFLTPQKRKEIYCHCSQLVNVLNHCCILCQLWFTATLSVPALRGANFPPKNGNARGWRRVSRQWHRQIWKRREKKGGRRGTVGVRRGLPPFFSSSHFFPLFLSVLPSLPLACVSAALSDATLQSESAIATSGACSVSLALTLASSPFRRGVVVAAVRGGGGGESFSQGGGGIIKSLTLKRCSFQTVCTSLNFSLNHLKNFSQQIWQLAARYIKTAELVCSSRFRDRISSQNDRRGGQSFFLCLNQRADDSEVVGSQLVWLHTWHRLKYLPLAVL